jgi:hypothetical protein
MAKVATVFVLFMLLSNVVDASRASRRRNRRKKRIAENIKQTENQIRCEFANLIFHKNQSPNTLHYTNMYDYPETTTLRDLFEFRQQHCLPKEPVVFEPTIFHYILLLAGVMFLCKYTF